LILTIEGGGNPLNLVVLSLFPSLRRMRTDEDVIRDSADLVRCCAHRDKSEHRSMTIKFLLENLKSSGCDVPAYKEFVRCAKCPSKMAGAFGMNIEKLDGDGADVNKVLGEGNKRTGALENNLKSVAAAPRNKPNILLCSNAAFSYDFVEETISHELIHAIDICRAKLPKDESGQWSSCRQMACSEIRASNLSGECRWGKEFWRGNGMKIGGQQMACVKRRANLSLKAHEKCADKSEKIIESIFDVCYRDTYPFERHPDS